MDIKTALTIFDLCEKGDVTHEELKKRYRRLCLLYHSDTELPKGMKEEQQKEMFLSVCEAYKTLCRILNELEDKTVIIQSSKYDIIVPLSEYIELYELDKSIEFTCKGAKEFLNKRNLNKYNVAIQIPLHYTLKDECYYISFIALRNLKDEYIINVYHNDEDVKPTNIELAILDKTIKIITDTKIRIKIGFRYSISVEVNFFRVVEPKGFDIISNKTN